MWRIAHLRASINVPKRATRAAYRSREDLPDHQLAEHLNAEGLRTWTREEMDLYTGLLDAEAIRRTDRLPLGSAGYNEPMVWYRAKSQPNARKSFDLSSIYGSSTACFGMISACLERRLRQTDGHLSGGGQPPHLETNQRTKRGLSL
jgi:hypothetical protein